LLQVINFTHKSGRKPEQEDLLTDYTVIFIGIKGCLQVYPVNLKGNTGEAPEQVRRAGEHAISHFGRIKTQYGSPTLSMFFLWHRYANDYRA